MLVESDWLDVKVKKSVIALEFLAMLLGGGSDQTEYSILFIFIFFSALALALYLIGKLMQASNFCALCYFNLIWFDLKNT